MAVGFKQVANPISCCNFGVLNTRTIDFEAYSTAAEINLTKWGLNRAWMVRVTLSDPVVFHSALALAMMSLLSPRWNGLHTDFSELGRASEFYSELSSAVKLLNDRLSSKATATQAKTIWAIVQSLALEVLSDLRHFRGAPRTRRHLQLAFR